VDEVTTTLVWSLAPEIVAHGVVGSIVHLIIEPGSGVTLNWLVCSVLGQLGGVRETMQSLGGLMDSVSAHELLQPFVSVIVSVTVTFPVILGIATATVLELPPAAFVAPPL
jgi:hypothetical protein